VGAARRNREREERAGGWGAALALLLCFFEGGFCVLFAYENVVWAVMYGVAIEVWVCASVGVLCAREREKKRAKEEPNLAKNDHNFRQKESRFLSLSLAGPTSSSSSSPTASS
jgi:hypothetical protein